MSSAIEKLSEDNDGQPIELTHLHKRAPKRIGTANRYNTLDVEEASDVDDSDFTDEMPDLQSVSDSELDSDNDEQMTNEEVFQYYMQTLSLLMIYYF